MSWSFDKVRESSNAPAVVPVTSKYGFGTFGGVFTPAILTILGVILFMRSNFVIGHAGLFYALLILLFCKTISSLTGLSVSAISTNTPVAGGGAYYLISRSLGPEFGGAIGITLYLAQSFSVPFYILGFSEALVATFPALGAHFMTISLVMALILFSVAYVGASWAIRLQFVVLTVLGLSIVTFLGGALLAFDVDTLRDNLWPVSEDFLGSLGQESNPSFGRHGFWLLFAIYFPAVTGIMAGINMSGDLKQPSKSLPLGTMLAIGVSFLVYLLQMVLCAGAIERGSLIGAPYESLVSLALFGAGFIVITGVFAATISSAIGSFIAGPRVLQALSRDNLFTFTKPFASGSPARDEPRAALWLTMGLTLAVLLSANLLSDDALNSVAAIITMFFLATYGVTNLAAFIEAASRNPSFRPRFRLFHWFGSLLGAIGCVVTALLINMLATLFTALVTFAIWYWIRRKDLSTSFGDARRGFIYTRVRDNMLLLESGVVDAKNWRPTILVLSGNPHTRLTLVTYACWLEAGRGVVSMVQLLIGEFRELTQQRREALLQLRQFVIDNEIPSFVDVNVVPNFNLGLNLLLQAHSVGPLKPNLVMFGWSNEQEQAEAFFNNLRCAEEIGMSQVLVHDRGLPKASSNMRVDLWWRGRKNGSLMLILAHLLATNVAWRQAVIRVIRVVESESELESAKRDLKALISAARITAQVYVVVSQTPFAETLQAESGDASLVILGYNLPAEGQERSFQQRFNTILEKLPTTLLVCSSGDADLMA